MESIRDTEQQKWSFCFPGKNFSSSTQCDHILAKFCNLGKILNNFGKIYKVYEVFGKILNVIWQTPYAIAYAGQILQK